MVRERDLLRLVMIAGTKQKYAALRDRMTAALAQKGLRMQLHDSNNAFYANPGLVFKLKTDEVYFPSCSCSNSKNFMKT